MNNQPLNSLNHTAVLQLQIDAIVKTLTATDTDLRDTHFKRLEKIKEESIATSIATAAEKQCHYKIMSSVQ